MTSPPAPNAADPRLTRVTEPLPPAWLDAWCRLDEVTSAASDHEAVALRCLGRPADRWRVLHATIEDAFDLPPEALEALVAHTYDRLTVLAREVDRPAMLRFWNYVPDIHRPVTQLRANDGGEAACLLDQYMVFNAGRFAAMRRQGKTPWERSLAAASAVGHRGRSLHIFVLVGARAGRPFENPRQVPAYRYSSRFGPMPPCFARGTHLDTADTPYDRPVLLLSGTASVLGEATAHEDDRDTQITETVRNLDALLAAAPTPAARTDVRALRAYVMHPADEPCVVHALLEAFASVTALEVMPADLCRSDLLVEVEGLAVLSSSSAERSPLP